MGCQAIKKAIMSVSGTFARDCLQARLQCGKKSAAAAAANKVKKVGNKIKKVGNKMGKKVVTAVKVKKVGNTMGNKVDKEGTQTGKKRGKTGLACTEAFLASAGILPAKKAGKARVTQKVKKNTNKVVAYMRTSSKTNMNGDSQGRQLRAIQAQASQQGVKHNKITKVGECISGMAPMAMRKRLQDLLKNSQVSKIFVESASRVARSAKVAEEIYEAAKESGTEIVVANSPTLFKLNATPEQHFFRRVHFAVAEYERDCLVERLRSGLQASAAKRGGSNAQGRTSIMEKINPTKQQVKDLN